jgi:16S rRNA (guanine527-N7)-methyltransferase
MVSSALERVGLTFLNEEQVENLTIYANLLIRWNQRTNLTAIREPAAIVDRHLIESVAAAAIVPVGTATLLDYGTGGGLPGIPISICRPEIKVTLAESQLKKVAFLREVVRTLKLNAVIHPGRVAELRPRAWFEVVTLRAVDRMVVAVGEARERLVAGGSMIIYATSNTEHELLAAANPTRWMKHMLPDATLLLVCEV